MRIKYTIIFITILSFFFGILSCSQRGKDNRYNVTQKQLDIIKEKDSLSLTTEAYTVQNIDLFDIEKNEYKLKSLLSKKKIILKLSTLECSYCIEHSLNFLHEYEKLLGDENIMIMVNSESQRDFTIFKKSYGIQGNVFNINHQNLGLPVDSLNLPYLFITDFSLKPKNIFIPLKEIPIRTDDYFKTLTKFDKK